MQHTGMEHRFILGCYRHTYKAGSNELYNMQQVGKIFFD